MLSVPPPQWPYANDPVAGGFVNSLARPGGNVTGSTQFGPCRRLEGNGRGRRDTANNGAAEVQGAASFDGGFASMVKDRAEGLVLLEDILFGTERARLTCAPHLLDLAWGWPRCAP